MKNPIQTKVSKKLIQAIVTAGTAVGLSQSSFAEDVDTELLLLVDVSGSVDSSEYNLMMGGYEQAFRSASVLTAIQGGNRGAIAVSLVFWSANTQQATGVGWTKINNSTSANAFADAIANTTRQYNSMTAIGSAITHGTTLFGTETGGVDNGFSSNAQIIDISGDGEDNDTPPDGDRAQNVRDARDAAMATGIDMINGLPIGNAGGALVAYYTDNIIAGSSGGVDAFTQHASTFGDIQDTLETKLQAEIVAGANIAPEPSSVSMFAIGACMFIFRRNRN